MPFDLFSCLLLLALAVYFTQALATFCQRRGHRALDQAQPQKASMAYRQALRLAPWDAESHTGLGHALLAQNQWREAALHFERGYRLRRHSLFYFYPGRDWPGPKIRHDTEQLQYLQAIALLPPLGERLLAALTQLERRGTLSPGQRLDLARFWQRNIYLEPAPMLAGEVLNPNLDWVAIQATYQQQQWVCCDQLLTGPAWEAMRRFCLRSTIWHDDQKSGGYLGSYMDDGFNCGLLHQIAAGLRDQLPHVLGQLPLLHMWAYKYEPQGEGIGLHADGALVNVNFWLTPDEANLDPLRGGLVLYPVAAPAQWDFATYNTDTASMEAWLAQHPVLPQTIPYRCNRAVIFNSAFFHRSDRFIFCPGYANRRINITLLFGQKA